MRFYKDMLAGAVFAHIIYPAGMQAMDYADFFYRASALAIIWATFYGLVIRPGRVAERERQAAVGRLKPGSLVMTTHGMRGVVRAIDDRKKFIEVEIAQDVVCSLDESGIARILPTPVVESPAVERDNA